MKWSTKRMVWLMMTVLVAITGYQAYWLVGHFSTMNDKMHNDVREAVRIADVEEMRHRIVMLRKRKDVQHGRMDVSVDVNTQKNHTTVKNEVNRQQSAAQKEQQSSESVGLSDKDFSSILGDTKHFQHFGFYMQQGVHLGLDNIQDIEPAYFDSLLTLRLDSLGMSTLHRTILRQHSKDKPQTKGQMPMDTLIAIGPNNITYADTVILSIVPSNEREYIILLPSYRTTLVRQMSGILIASLLLLLVLGFVFWYLIHTLLRMKTLDEMKTDFTNNMTHELKTPISIAYAANDALLNFDMLEDKAKTRKYLNISQEQLRRLGRLVEQILSMSMEQRKDMKINMEKLGVEEVVRTVVNGMRLKTRRPVNFSVQIDDGLHVTADRTHLTNILENLVDNAIKYSKEEADVRIAAFRNNDTIEMKVQDRGIGISKEHQKYVFDRFYRVTHGNLHEVKGYGLGLFYVKSMMEKMNGKVEVESKIGKGSVFILKFYEQD